MIITERRAAMHGIILDNNNNNNNNLKILWKPTVEPIIDTRIILITIL